VATSPFPVVSVGKSEQIVAAFNLSEQSFRARMRAMNRLEQNAFNERFATRVPVRACGISSVCVSSNPFQPLRYAQSAIQQGEEKDYAGEGVVPRAPEYAPEPRRKYLPAIVRREVLRVLRHLRPVFRRFVTADLQAMKLRLRRVQLRPIYRVAELVAMKLRLRPVEWDEVVPAAVIEGPEFEEPVAAVEDAPLGPRDPEKDGPGNHIIGYRDRRLLDTAFSVHDFDHLDFIGKWNSGRVSEKMFVKHFGIHFNERVIRVRLPQSLVAEMKDWWTNRLRDAAWENYQLSEARCRVLVSELAITADEQYVANLYGPALGFILSWDKQQNVSRVVEGAHFDMRMYTGPKLKASWRTRFGRVAMVSGGIAALVAVGLSFFAAVKLRRAFTRTLPTPKFLFRRDNWSLASP